MKTKFLILVLVASLFLTEVASSFAQTPQGDWSGIQRLSITTNLFVKTSDGKTLIGSLVSADENEIELMSKGRGFSLARNNITAIYFSVPKTRRRARSIGAIAGSLAAVAVYVAAVGDNGDSGTGSPILLPIAGGLGGGFIGGLLGKSVKKGALIYKKP